jgi:hypothetical protein
MQLDAADCCEHEAIGCSHPKATCPLRAVLG